MISVEQAVYGSAHTRTIRGYQIIAQSPGVNDVLAAALMSWAPTRQAMASDVESFESLSAFIVLEDWLVISRSVYGRPEYSQRGELETSTRFLLAPWRRLEGYQFNPLWFTRTALSLGRLRMYSNHEPALSTIELPEEALIGVSTASPSTQETDHLHRALDEISAGRQVALIGVEDERAALSYILSHMPTENRVKLSFTTGLFPSGIRPFKLHFLTPQAYRASRGYTARNLVYLDATNDALVSN